MVRNFLFLSLILFSFFSNAKFTERQKTVIALSQKYLNDFHSLQADFTQNHPDNKLEIGKLYLKKPGKFRFNYENKLLVISTGDTVIYCDKELEKNYFIKLEDTLFSIFSYDIDFSSEKILMQDIELKNDYSILAFSLKNIEEENLIKLRFINKPFSLSGISIIHNHYEINLDLYNLQLNSELDDKLFTYSSRKRE